MSGLRERMNRLRNISRANEELAAAQAAVEELQPIAQTAESNAGREDVAEAAASSASIANDACWSRMNVQTVDNEWGSFLRRQVIYPLDHRHGHHRLAELGKSATPLAAFHPAAAVPPAADNLLFLDLETTGLGMGAGNLPFMVGMAFASDGQFIIEQALIRHPAEERAMLAYFDSKASSFEYIVTYNGKSFDWPVLASRYIMNGLGRLKADPQHLDFLHPSRSIWKNTLVSCRLSHVEEERLGFFRVDDVPGSEAPAIYFQFLADGNPEPLEGVFHHNELDMLSLAALAIRFGCILDGRLGDDTPYPEYPEELLRTGLWLEKMGKMSLAEPLFASLQAMEDKVGSWSLPLAAREKKIGNWERAVLLWQKVAVHAQTALLPHHEAHIELAMYFEHRMKDPLTALSYSETALELVLRRANANTGSDKQRNELEQLRKRIERLRKKTARLTSS
ncbi:hypothetical protein EBB07_12710 [Paenibacillaceae bacterium]|nr:hypothetical protein EBB07_12710 [Paenibacillaceae bacterium]